MRWTTPQRRQLVDRTMADLTTTASPTTSSVTVRLPLVRQQASPANQFASQFDSRRLPVAACTHPFPDPTAGLSSSRLTLSSISNDEICHFLPVGKPIKSSLFSGLRDGWPLALHFYG